MKAFWEGLTKKQKIGLVSCASAATIILGYVGYKVLTRPKKRVYNHPLDEDEDFVMKASRKKSDKEICMEIMDEAILECLDCIDGLVKISRRVQDAADIEKAQCKDEIHLYIETIISSSEEKFCRQQEISVETYLNLVKSKISWRNLKQRLSKIKEIIKAVISCQFPTIELQCDYWVTMPLTITICRWITVSNLYLDYMTITNWLKEKGDLTSEELAKLIVNNGKEKLKIRYFF